MSTMKKFMVMLPVSAMTLFVALPRQADAQIAIAEVIKAGVKKVIKAVDLKVQRLQNETIWLQNAQKVLENQLSKLKLTEIADWAARQQELYGKYYNELWEIKATISYYHKLKELTDKQVAIVEEYRWAWNLFNRDKHFRTEELAHMESVYQGMLDASLNNLDQLLLVVESFRSQMSDTQRMEQISKVAQAMDDTYRDLRQFNTQNSMLSIQRAASLEEVTVLKELYGIK